ncbi:class I SAM-dependent RNA methyltransferase [Treponema brennaborense]|uniref:Deoxyribonuclease/rho motif-related TRAM n=1 Tax=Treponema brennaborense (strain DSM 12168 / CIP 105900 / DD5/3) TaxID=906968 RepID=F4LNU2_TREBD|nr:TRAM domain-containing protein [Treponema brennaborense]AEE16927.1 deoxyribonuclease/rho motif-related TRAM [Treponema brennaborense DSM 12168]
MTRIVTIEKLITGGDGLAKIDGKSVFVPGVIPGETAEIEITGVHKDYDTARLVRVAEPSPFRIENSCPYYGRCGGCNMRHIAPAYQQELRTRILGDLFKRENIEIPSLEIISGSTDSYRCRFQLHDGGLKSRSGSEIVPIADCPVATEEIRSWMRQTPCEHRPRGRVHLFGDRRVETEAGVQQRFPNVLLARETAQPETKRIIGKTGRPVKDTVKKRFSGTVYAPENVCTVALQPHETADRSENQEKTREAKRISFDVRGFFQSNLEVLEKTVFEICRFAGTGRMLDLYSGAGTFSVFLAETASAVTLVEHNRDALAFAERNLTGVPHTSYGISGSKWITAYAEPDIRANGPYDCAVVDPPRSGMEKDVRNFLGRSAVPRVCSVSCDPATQARDCSALIRAGYELKKLYLLDFYPQTSHIESLALLEKNV